MLEKKILLFAEAIDVCYASGVLMFEDPDVCQSQEISLLKPSEESKLQYQEQMQKMWDVLKVKKATHS